MNHNMVFLTPDQVTIQPGDPRMNAAGEAAMAHQRNLLAWTLNKILRQRGPYFLKGHWPGERYQGHPEKPLGRVTYRRFCQDNGMPENDSWEICKARLRDTHQHRLVLTGIT